MPLYVDDEDILAQFTNMGVVQAILLIKEIASDTAITPAVAKQLIQLYLRPLASVEGQVAFDKKRKTSWNSIFFLYSDIGFCSKNDDDLWQVACAVKLLHSHSKQLPREFEFAPIEVNIFFQLCGYLRLPTQDVRYPSGHREIDPLCFCALCWRQPLPGRKLCGYHALSGPERFNNDGRSVAARYKSGIRQKELFEKTVNRILTRETIEFHESSFMAQTLLPEQDIVSWLAERRPAVWRELGSFQRGLTDGNAVKILLNVLHNPEALPSKAKALYRIINEHIQSHPALIWPMLVRAEGWYQSREIQERNWGGKRPRAGRREQANISE